MTLGLHRALIEAAAPPRGLLLAWPYGHPFGQPGQANQQVSVLLAALDLLHSAQPGQIVVAGWRWRRETYSDPLLPGASWPRAGQPPGPR